MAEAEIKRVNFFDGQFLKEAEFNDLSDYMVHMRRRLLFVLFNQSGVIQAGGGDLVVEIPNPAQKIIRVKAGMAIGKRADLAEAKEIILREDTQIDLTVAQNTDVVSVPAALTAGDTAIVTVHYEELPVKDPPSEGDVSGDTRIKERARLTVHRNQLSPGPNAANGEPFVRLGNVAFNTMQPDPAQRQTSFLQVGLFAATPQISLSPNTVPASGAVTITVTSSGGLTLTGATAANVTISNVTGITNVAVSNVQTNSMMLSFTLTNAAAGPGTVMLSVNNVSASTTFTVQSGMQLSGFTGVNEPNNDLQFEISGSGFQAPATLEFTASGGGFVATTQPPTVTPTQLTIPMSQIPANATSGPVRVQSGGQMVTGTFNVVPPATFIPNTPNAPFAFNPLPVGKNQLLTITGSRFFGPGSILFGGNATVTLPPTGPGESMSATQIVVLVPGSATSGKVAITTPGGTVQSAATVVVL